MKIIPRNLINQPLVIALSIHLMGVLFIFTLSHFRTVQSKSNKVPFTIYQPTPHTIEITKPVSLQLQLQKKIIKNKIQPHAVFGLNNKSLTSTTPLAGSNNSVVLKNGNTVAKEMDHEVLKPGDADSLPIPTDEFLISNMPIKISDIQVPYPPAAETAKIEGPVIMDILIDEKGVVRNAILIQGPGYGLNEAALGAVYQFRFQPAQVDNKPVAVKIRYTYRFILKTK